MPNVPLKWRRYIYGVAIPTLPLLVAYGALDNQKAALWLAVVGGVVVPGLALRNAPRDDE